MFVRVASQIFGSVVGAGTLSTGLWFGINKLWDINSSVASTENPPQI